MQFCAACGQQAVHFALILGDFLGPDRLGRFLYFCALPDPLPRAWGAGGYFDRRCQLPATVSELAVTAAPLLVHSTAAAQGGARAGCPPLTTVGEGGRVVG